MFGKDKVKGHSRVIKTKKGLKVTRVGDFLRKKDENRNRNIALGVGATAILGVGTALLLKKKGIKFPGQVSKKNPLAKVNDNVVVPKSNNTPSPGEKFIKEMDEEFGILPNTTKPKVSNDIENIVKNPTSKNSDLENPWDTPIKTTINKSSETLVKPNRSQLLLSPAKKPNPRGNLARKEMLVESNKTTARRIAKSAATSAKNMEKTQQAYDSLPLDMKLTIQMEKLLRRPTRTSNLGRPPESTGLKTILDDSDKTPIDKVISKAKRKVGDRLKRESEIAEKRASDIKKNN